MPFPPFDFTDVILQFALGTIMLLLTAELSTFYFVKTKPLLSKKRLERAGLVSGILFLCVVGYRVANILWGI